jgi:hypothetical protein
MRLNQPGFQVLSIVDLAIQIDEYVPFTSLVMGIQLYLETNIFTQIFLWE